MIYMDYNSTTPVDERVTVSIHEALRFAWGNPSSNHVIGKNAKALIEAARQQCAKMINAGSTEIIFTSGGTESNHSIINSFLGCGSESSSSRIKALPHFVTSTIEHDSILKPLKLLVKQGLATMTLVEVNPKSYRVEVVDVINAVQPSTVLVSVMLANNETGVIQPIERISKAVKDYNETHGTHIAIHTDAAQALGKVIVNVKELGVDYLTIVGHKFYGPRIGAIFVKGHGTAEGAMIKPVFYGGGQEGGIRAGTENTAMIAGLGTAAAIVTNDINVFKRHMEKVRDYLEQRLAEVFGDAIAFNGRSDHRLPNTCNISFKGLRYKGNVVLVKCKLVVASVGAACHSNMADEGSAVLRACKVPLEIARNAIRLSIGRETTMHDIDLVIDDLQNAIKCIDADIG